VRPVVQDPHGNWPGIRLNGQGIAVVGGGLLGMFLALRLRQSGAEVTLFESADRSGGLAGSTPSVLHSYSRAV